MDLNLWQITAPFVGGVVLELIHWHELRERTGQAKYQKLIRSVSYWLITAAMVAGGALVALYWAVSKDEAPSPFELLIAGAAAPSLVKNAIASLLAKEKTELGEEDKQKVTPRTYFVPGS